MGVAKALISTAQVFDVLKVLESAKDVHHTPAYKQEVKEDA